MEQPRRMEATNEQEDHPHRRGGARDRRRRLKTVLAKPSEKGPEPKVHGTVYVLPKEFLVNLADGRYAKLQVALVVEAAAAAGHGGGHGAPVPPDGYGSEPQEAIVRDLITDELTNAS